MLGEAMPAAMGRDKPEQMLRLPCFFLDSRAEKASETQRQFWPAGPPHLHSIAPFGAENPKHAARSASRASAHAERNQD